MRDLFARPRVTRTPNLALRGLGGLRALMAAALTTLAAVGWSAPAVAQRGAEPACPTPPSMPTSEQLAQAQREARDRGLLWRISRDGRSGWLYGTMHVGKVGWIAPGPKLREALIESDTIALEIDPSDPLLQRQMARASVQPAPALPDELKRRLNVQRDALCLQDSVFDRLHPVLQLTTLGMVAARREGLDATFGSEITLAGFGKATGKRVVSLESVERQFAALIPPDLDAAELEALLRSGLDQFEGDVIRSSTRRLASAWERGVIDDIEGYAAWCGCIRNDADRRLMARLNDGRNPALADSIAAVHARGAKLFAAIGALHMTGEQGLPKLLAQRGFTVERIAFTP